VDARLLIERVLEDEGLTAGLDEPEATLVVSRVVDRVRELAAQADDHAAIRRRVDELCRRARAIAEVVATFRDCGERVAAETAKRHQLTMPANTQSLLQHLLDTLTI
jgi:hypothetical protein